MTAEAVTTIQGGDRHRTLHRVNEVKYYETEAEETRNPHMNCVKCEHPLEEQGRQTHQICAKTWLVELLRYIAREVGERWSSRITNAMTWEAIEQVGMFVGQSLAEMGGRINDGQWDIFQRWYVRNVGPMPARTVFLAYRGPSGERIRDAFVRTRPAFAAGVSAR